MGERFRRVTSMLLAIGLSLTLSACRSASVEPLGAEGQVTTVVGEVLSVDASEMAVDGPGRIELWTQEHGEITVLLPSCMGPCARQALESFFEMEEEERWEITGEVSADGGLSVHDDSLHGLQQLEEM